jgi:hypothetical protein
MRIGIIGSRGVTSTPIVESVLQEVVGPLQDDCTPLTFLGGGSKGSERIAALWASAEGYDYVLFKPYNFVDTSADHDPKYFFYRNKQIVDNSDAVIVFLEDSENGVKKTIDYIKNRTGKPYTIFDPNGINLESRGKIESSIWFEGLGGDTVDPEHPAQAGAGVDIPEHNP